MNEQEGTSPHLNQSAEELRKENDLLKQKLESYFSLFNSMSEVIYIQDIDGIFLDANQAALDLYGYSRDEIIGSSHEMLSQKGANDLSAIKEKIIKAYSGETQRFEFWGKSKEGVVFPREIILKKGVYMNKQVVIAEAKDISKFKKMEHTSQESLDKYKALFDLSNDAIIIFSLKGEVVDCNAVARNLFGCSETELKKNNVKNLIPEELIKSFQEATDESIIDFKEELEYTAKKFDSTEFPVEITTKFFHEGDTKRFIVFLRDITSRKDIENKLNSIASELAETNAMKDKFFSIISHDMRTPFHGLLGFSDYLTTDIDSLSKEEIKQISASINNSAKGLFNYFENLLTWSNVQSGRLKFKNTSIKISEIIKRAVSIINVNANSKVIKINTELDEDLFVYSDENMLSSVIQNLISNAVKFTEIGGKVTIKSRRKGEQVEVSITDTGVGMNEEKLKNLFKIDHARSSKGTSNEKGTGLGLIIAKELIEKQGGTLIVESEVGKGSTFKFSLPKGEPIE